MGTLNKGCILTGLEIVEGDEVFAAALDVQPVRFEGHSISTPPLQGIYSGYGDIELTEDVPCLGLTKGQDLGPSPDGRSALVYINAEVFRELTGLSVDQPSGKSFADVALDNCQDLHDEIASTLVKPKRLSFLASGRIRDILTITEASHQRSRDWTGLGAALEAGIDNPQIMESAMELYARSRVLRLAEAELRRPLVPTSWGPQECVPTARLQINEIAGRLITKQVITDCL